MASRLPVDCFVAALLAMTAQSQDRDLPSLIRFLVACAVLAALVYAGLFALANFVKVKPREITQTIQLPKAGK
jgi:high-affinity Fe2+/Pb2+ permease